MTVNLRNLRNDQIPIMYADIINTWQSLNFDRKIPSNKELIVKEFLFSNKLITNSNGDTLYFLEWMQRGIIQIGHIWRNNSFITVDQLLARLAGSPRIRHQVQTQFQTIKDSLHHDIRRQLVETRNGDDVERVEEVSVQDLFKVNKKMLTCSEMYHRLLHFKTGGFVSALAVLESLELEEKA